jgi:hypothetical protein
MEQSPSWESISHSDIQENPRLLGNQKVPYRVHKSPQVVPILCHLQSVHPFPPNLPKILSNMSSHLRIGLPSSLFPPGIETKMYRISYLPYACCMPCLYHDLDRRQDFFLWLARIWNLRLYSVLALHQYWVCTRAMWMDSSKGKGKGKSKVALALNWAPRREGVWGVEWRYSSLYS